MRDAFADQVVSLIPQMRVYATSLTGSSVDADDVVQDALMRAWRFRAGFQMGTNLRGWLFRIVRNTFYSSAALRREVVEILEDDLGGGMSSSPDQEWRLRYGELLSALDELTRDSREALLLVAVSGLTYHEAAEVMGCSVGAVKSRVNRARVRLAELIDFETHVGQRRIRTAQALGRAAPMRAAPM